MQINPYIEFNGNCAEAMNFYKSVFGGELTIKTYAETPEDIPDGQKDKVMHALLIFNDIEIMGYDIIHREKAVNGTSVALSLEYDNLEEAERVFNKLSEGSSGQLSFKYTFWGTKFGLFSDKFGIQWMITL